MNNHNGRTIGIDIGGTRIKGVVIDRDGNILHQVVHDTGDDPENKRSDWKENVKYTVGQITKELDIDVPVGLSAPGLTSVDHQSIAFMPGRLQGLENLVWSDYLKLANVYVINDAKAALLAECEFGTGQGHKDVMLLTLGTGIGGALLINGQLYNGFLHRAGHLGHMSMDPRMPTGILNLPGTLEYLVGNATIKERTGGRFHSTHDLVKAYRHGDKFALDVWRTTVDDLARGISSLINVISPEVIILSGGMVQAGEDLFGLLDEFMQKYEWRPMGANTPVLSAKFTEYAGAVGAATFARYQSTT